MHTFSIRVQVADIARGLLLTLSLALASPWAWGQDTLRIGSKRFTESYVLAQVVAQTAQPHERVEVKAGLGNTAIVYAALRAGSIDVYPEYAGTIAQEILKDPGATSLEAMRAGLAPLGLGVDVPLGFNDGYALAMLESRAQALGIRTLSDLARHPALRLGLSNEFIGRQDGWVGLARRYHLAQQPQGLDHGLAYDAVAAQQVDVIDIYTTDAKIDHLGLRVLADDAAYFPRYDAVLLYRLDVPARFPAAWRAIKGLAGQIDERAMITMNAQAELKGMGFEAIATLFLGRQDPPTGNAGQTAAQPGFWDHLFGADLVRLTQQHLGLVLCAIALAAGLGVPLAVGAAQHARTRTVLLGVCSLLQTVPALALLALLIAMYGAIGWLPALTALTLYALLPIMRNTCTGLAEIPQGLRMAGMSLGLSRWQQLRLIEVPLALPSILAGIRTATSIAVGTATIAAFVGAGGYGERIVTGLALNDQALMLAGAAPAAALALLFEAGFEWLAWRLRSQSITGPRAAVSHLRGRSSRDGSAQ